MRAGNFESGDTADLGGEHLIHFFLRLMGVVGKQLADDAVGGVLTHADVDEQNVLAGQIVKVVGEVGGHEALAF